MAHNCIHRRDRIGRAKRLLSKAKISHPAFKLSTPLLSTLVPGFFYPTTVVCPYNHVPHLEHVNTLAQRAPPLLESMIDAGCRGFHKSSRRALEVAFTQPREGQSCQSELPAQSTCPLILVLHSGHRSGSTVCGGGWPLVTP